MSKHKTPWLVCMATHELEEQLQDAGDSFLKSKTGVRRFREFKLGLVQVWTGYLRHNRFQKQAGLKDQLRFLRDLLIKLRPHYQQSKDWESVRIALTRAIRDSTEDYGT